MACLSMKIMMRFSILAWASLAEASLKHMRAHGHDEKKSKAIEVRECYRCHQYLSHYHSLARSPSIQLILIAVN